MTRRKDAKIAVMEQKFLLSPWASQTSSANKLSSVLLVWMRTASFVSPDNISKFSHLLSICWVCIQRGNEGKEKCWNLTPTALETPLTTCTSYYCHPIVYSLSNCLPSSFKAVTCVISRIARKSFFSNQLKENKRRDGICPGNWIRY